MSLVSNHTAEAEVGVSLGTKRVREPMVSQRARLGRL